MGHKSPYITDFLHNLLSIGHPDTNPSAVVAGDLVYGNATPKWDRLALGTQGQVLTVNAGAPQWTFQASLNADYYLADSASDIALYKDLVNSVPAGAKTSVSAVITSGDGVPQTIQNWVTQIGSPGTTFIPAGVWNVHVHAFQSVGTEGNTLTAEIYKRTHPGGVETLLGVAGPSIAINQDSESEYDVDASIAAQTLSATDRIVVRIRSTPNGAGTNGTVVIYYQGDTASRISFPSSSLTISHHVLSDLTTFDDHTQYLLLAGRAGGQVGYGGINASDTLTLEGTANATKGNITLNLAGGNVGVGITPTTTQKFVVFMSDSSAPNLNTVAIRGINSGLGGTSGEIVGGLLRAQITDIGVGNYGTARGINSIVYVGIDATTTLGVAYTGTVTTATGQEVAVDHRSTGASIITTARSWVGNVLNTGATSIIRNAIGLEVASVQATGTDAGQTHIATGLLIDSSITASGGDANTAYAIHSLSTADSVFVGLIQTPTVQGSALASGTLTFISTAHATKGKILFGTSGYDEVNNRLGVGNSAPSVPLHVTGQSRFTLQMAVGTTPTSSDAFKLNLSTTDVANASLVNLTGVNTASAGNISNAYGIINQPIFGTANDKKLVNPLAMQNKAYITGTQSTHSVVMADTLVGTVSRLATYTAGTPTGTISTGIAFSIQAFNQEAASADIIVTNLFGLQVGNQGTAAGAATVAIGSAAGIAITDITGATNNVGLLIGTTTIPAGTFAFYSASAAVSAILGNIWFGASDPAGAGIVRINGALTVSSATLLETKTTLTNGAGIQPGTLTNAPAAGNPTKWFPVNDNGTVRYVPSW